jgi:PAS domain S-box-containing protein
MTQNDSDANRGRINRPIACPPEEGQGLLWHNLTDFYCNFFDLIDVMAIMVDVTGTIRMFNRKAEKMTGYSKAESVGQDCFFMLLPEYLRADAREKLMRGLEKGTVPSAVSMSVITRGGVEIPVDWSISVVRDDDGKVFGLVGLGYLPAVKLQAVGLSNTTDNIYSYVEVMTHDLLNHSQVALGYLELAMERAGDDADLQCMLNRACNALKKCGNIAINVRKLSSSPGINGYARLTGSRKESQK